MGIYNFPGRTLVKFFIFFSFLGTFPIKGHCQEKNKLIPLKGEVSPIKDEKPEDFQARILRHLLENYTKREKELNLINPAGQKNLIPYQELFSSENSRYEKRLYFDKKNILKFGFIETEALEKIQNKKAPIAPLYLFSQRGWVRKKDFNFDPFENYARANQKTPVYSKPRGTPIGEITPDNSLFLIGQLGDYLIISY